MTDEESLRKRWRLVQSTVQNPKPGENPDGERPKTIWMKNERKAGCWVLRRPGPVA
jgi:hypothetical protein